ncbi:MAG: CAP domain-containing protein [Planctomycetaceae bacterium]|nr:CAP domain-containing protein [Planctomycetaceae bacterium]
MMKNFPWQIACLGLLSILIFFAAVQTGAEENLSAAANTATNNISIEEKQSANQSDESKNNVLNEKSDANKADEKEKKDIVAPKKPLVIDGLVLTETERKVFELTNDERRKRGLPTLRLDRRLMESARRQANWMARTGIFKHGASGYAENIAMGQRSSFDVIIAWMNSSGHRQNMMSRGHGAIGVGSYRGFNGAMYWCQQFAR